MVSLVALLVFATPAISRTGELQDHNDRYGIQDQLPSHTAPLYRGVKNDVPDKLKYLGANLYAKPDGEVFAMPGMDESLSPPLPAHELPIGAKRRHR